LLLNTSFLFLQTQNFVYMDIAILEFSAVDVVILLRLNLSRKIAVVAACAACTYIIIMLRCGETWPMELICISLWKRDLTHPSLVFLQQSSHHRGLYLCRKCTVRLCFECSENCVCALLSFIYVHIASTRRYYFHCASGFAWPAGRRRET
jgi:hypothetical protein